MAKKKVAESKDGPSKDLAQLEEQKIRLEILELEGNVKHALFNRILAAIGGVSFLIVLFTNAYFARVQRDAESMAAREQRDAEGRAAAYVRTLERMTQIAKEFDQLYAQTLEVTTKAELGRFSVLTWHEMLLENAEALAKKEKTAPSDEDATKPTKPAAEILSYLQTQIEAYKNRKFALGDFMSAVTIETEWKSRHDSFSPDFAQLFGDEVEKAYPEVSSAAQTLLVARVGLSLDSNSDAKDKFVEAASKFQKAMYEKIRGVSESGSEMTPNDKTKSSAE